MGFASLFGMPFLGLIESASNSLTLPILSLYGGLGAAALFLGFIVIQNRARAKASQMVDRLVKSDATLAVVNEQLSATINSLRDGIITTDKEGRILSINKAGETLTGWTAADAAGKHLDDVFQIIHQRTRQPRLSPLKSMLRVGGLAGYENPTLLITRQGSERVISDNAAPLLNAKGREVGVVVVFRDITEEKKTEAEILKASKLESVGQLAGGIAHDYNNILTAIIGNVSLARRAIDSKETILKRLDAVDRAALRAKDLTKQLLTFAKGGAPIRRPVVPSKLIREATDFALHGTNVSSEYSISSELWTIEVDEEQIRQTLNNIIINAVEAMPDGGKVRVQAENVEILSGFTSALKPGKHVKITITDGGSGIAPEHLPYIFDPYFSTKKDRSGLGLAAAFSVVRKHEGHIEAKSAVGSGTTITIYIPATDLPAVVEQAPVAKPVTAAARGRILVMDDETEILNLVTSILGASGYEVHTATDGKQAIAKYRAAKDEQRPFSAVIMDLTIPNGMGGKETVQHIKAMDPEARVIVSSGYSFDPIMAHHRRYGFCGVIPKPYRSEDLQRVLDEVTGNLFS